MISPRSFGSSDFQAASEAVYLCCLGVHHIMVVQQCFGAVDQFLVLQRTLRRGWWDDRMDEAH
jgi:hypothetical protein